ncbi:hypothetical protein U27_03405 [Candidatus Vecturithrix granuli]|uniref:Uncharacterized protein n=1 Tax=Vecturithrix granuli TaxID=1499967 RepID=A0A081BVT8_VECG1|nr:hypothetical protein U27_03405 [Candidatus Vecturithrix granuli]
MKKYPQQIKHQLHELAMIATEAELFLQLTELAEKFESWKQDAISSRELRHILLTYVDGPSRELFRRNRELPDDIVVADAIVRGLLNKDDIAEELWPYLQNGVQFYQDVATKNRE